MQIIDEMTPLRQQTLVAMIRHQAASDKAVTAANDLAFRAGRLALNTCFFTPDIDRQSPACPEQVQRADDIWRFLIKKGAAA
jgi:hypothetical protein